MVKMYGAILAISSQQVSGVSAPTAVSIATGSSGNFNNALVAAEVQVAGFVDVHDFVPSNTDPFDFNYNSNFGAYVATKDVDVGDFAGFNGLSGASDIALRAYCRATSATTFAWTISVHSDTDYSGGTVAVLTSGGTAQDSTGTNGAGVIRMTFGGGKGGQTFPLDGDKMVLKLECTASNAGGSTDATPVIIIFKYVT